ncbi:MAG: DUF4838 domain-containing protein [Roseburia sp.]|jgi:hypothetical protein|nr:DUF4838 domain-containing protein [Roseburia sp.]
MNVFLFYKTDSATISFAVSEFCNHLLKVLPDISFIHNSESVSKASVQSKLYFETDASLSHSDIDDAYEILVEEYLNGYIHGSNERSVLLAVYAFLRKIGFRFLLPCKTIYPNNLLLDNISVNITWHAFLRHRGICIEGADSLENVLDFIDWLPKLGFNSFFLQFREPYIFLERWYHHTLNPMLKPVDLPDTFLQSCYQQMNEALKKRGLISHAYGHGWTCEAIGLPSIGWVKDNREPSEYIRRMLALVDGKRTYIDAIPMNTNLCYSNPNAVEHFCSTVVSYIESHPDVDYLHIWLADEPNHVCECEQCKKSTPTDQYIRMLNEIDKRLTEKHLDCKLVFLLYQELLYPPKQEHLLHPERFTLMFAPISRTFKVSYPDHITEETLPDYERNHMTLPVTIKENLSYLAKWQINFSGDSFIYDYPLGRAHYGDFGYVSISKVLAGDIKNVKNLGLDGYMSCQELRVFLPNGLPNYIMGYITADSKESFELLMKEYYSAAYGENYENVMQYLTTVSKLSDCDYINHIGERINLPLSLQYQQLLSHVTHFSECIKQQMGKLQHDHSSNGSIQLFFWKLLDYHSKYVTYFIKALISLTEGNTYAANQQYRLFCDFIRENENCMQPYLDVYRILEVTTKYTGFTLPENK